MSHAGALGLDKEGPRSVEHHWLGADETLDQMFDRGELDLVTAIRPQPRVTAGDATVIDRWGGAQLAGNSRLRKLFPDDGKTVVFDYYRKTGFFQPNHHVIVQNRILKEHPWVALELYDAFRRSKEIAYDRACRLAGTLVYFPGLDIEEQRAVIGDDPFPLGLAAMGRNIERAIQGSVEQGRSTSWLMCSMRSARPKQRSFRPIARPRRTRCSPGRPLASPSTASISWAARSTSASNRSFPMR